MATAFQGDAFEQDAFQYDAPATAFQDTAFQNNAFQIYGGVPPTFKLIAQGRSVMRFVSSRLFGRIN